MKLNRKVAIAASTVAVAGMFGLTACNSAAPAKTAPKPPATTQPAVPNLTAQVGTWTNGSGMADLQAVRADMQTIHTDGNAEDVPAVEADGLKLAHDSHTAATNPPPVGGGAYVRAMNHWTVAGIDMAAGNLTAAIPEVQAGTTDMQVASAELNVIAPGAITVS